MNCHIGQQSLYIMMSHHYCYNMCVLNKHTGANWGIILSFLYLYIILDSISVTALKYFVYRPQ